MRDTEFPVRWPGGYDALPGLSDPWKVTKVQLNSAAGRVDVWIPACRQAGKTALVSSGAAQNAKRK